MLESGFRRDDGTEGQDDSTAPSGQLFRRQAYVDPGSRWGNVTLGRLYPPHYIALEQVDPFSTGLAGDATNLMSTVMRMNDTMRFSTPTWAASPQSWRTESATRTVRWS